MIIGEQETVMPRVRGVSEAVISILGCALGRVEWDQFAIFR